MGCEREDVSKTYFRISFRSYFLPNEPTNAM